LELNIEVKQAKTSKAVNFFNNKKLGVAKKLKHPTEYVIADAQDNNSNSALIRQSEMKRLVSKEGAPADTDEFDIQLQVPRMTVGKKNQIVDNTLFVKRFADKAKEQEGVVATLEERFKVRKKVSREEYMREMDESIKNRRAQSISSQEICASFVMTSLDDV